MAVLPVSRTGNPGLTADVNAGFLVGSVWTNTSTKVTFVCLDNTAGAAVWSSNPRNRQTSGAPTVTDDTTLGYAAGSLWTDTTAAKVYACISAALGAAVWTALGTAAAVFLSGAAALDGQVQNYTGVPSTPTLAGSTIGTET